MNQSRTCTRIGKSKQLTDITDSSILLIMTELEKNPLNHKFNFFKKKDAFLESTFIEDRVSHLMVFIFFQPLSVMGLFLMVGATNTQEISQFFEKNYTTIFNYGLHVMALISIRDFITCFLKGFKSRKTIHDWGRKWIQKAFSLSLTNFFTYYAITFVMYPLAKDIFKNL